MRAMLMAGLLASLLGPGAHAAIVHHRLAEAQAAAKAVLATQAAAGGDGRDPGKRKRAARDEPLDESDDSSESELKRNLVEAAVKSVLAAHAAGPKDPKKARKGAAQLRGSKYNNDASD